MTDYLRLPAFDYSGSVHVVVEASKSSTAKCKYELALGAFLFTRPLPHGLCYPFNWGFVPSTCGDDGDPMDAVVLHDATCAVGTIIRCKTIGVLNVEQTQSGKTERNDRFIFRPTTDPLAESGETYSLGPHLKKQLEEFFRAVVFDTGKTLKFLGWDDVKAAERALRQGGERFAKTTKRLAS